MSPGPGRRNRIGGLVVSLGLSVVGCSDDPTVATLRLELAPLRHEVSAEGVLKAAKVTAVTVPRDVRGRVRLAWVAPEGSLVHAGQVVARFDDSDLLSLRDQGEADLASAGFKVRKTTAEQVSVRAEIDTSRRVADLELEVAERFQLTDEAIFSRHEIIESEIDGALATVRRDHAIADQHTAKVSGRAALDILEIERGEAQRKVTRANDGLEAIEIRAPHDGLFLRARDWLHEPLQVGAELWPGQSVGEIPDLASLEIEAFVLEADAGGLEVGKSASVVVEAHPDKRYAATIDRVDTIAKPRFRGSPVQYFGVSLTFDDAMDTWLKPGQRVRASLLLAAKDAVLALPRQAVVAQGDSYRVYLAEGGGFVPREVTLGETATGLVEITAGLEVGDRVALEPKALDATTKGSLTGVGGAR